MNTKARLLLLVFCALLIFCKNTSASADSTDGFLSDGMITVAGVNYGSSSTSLLIMSNSGAESWAYDSGLFTVVNPNGANIFKVGSSDSSVSAIYVLDSGKSIIACAKNVSPGSSYVSLPSSAGTYRVEPADINLPNSLTYNYLCGAASCIPGYVVSGVGASAICIQPSSGSIGGGTGAPRTDSVVVPKITSIAGADSAVSANQNSNISKKSVEVTAVVNNEKQLTKKIDKTLIKRLTGRILLQTENLGRAWYVDPVSLKRYFLADGQSAYDALRKFGLGIKNKDIAKIPVGLESMSGLVDSDNDGLHDKFEEALGTNPNKVDTDGDGFNDDLEIKNGYSPLGKGKNNYSSQLVRFLQGRIVLQTESRGEAWYINPVDGKRYYLANGDAAYQIMRLLSLGIANKDIYKITVGN